MTNEAAKQLAKLRWKGTTKAQRKEMVPRTGGRPRIYPQCSRYKAHRFVNDRCPCGYERKTTKKGEKQSGTHKH
jgi:hypothetical protein